MGTRSNVIVQHADGTFSRIYCHWDGYLSCNGKLLHEHYNTLEKVEALVALGDLSSLAPSIERPPGHTFDKPKKGYTTFYGRDRGEQGTEPRKYDHIDKALLNMEEYAYVFMGGKWFVTQDPGEPLKELAAALAEEEGNVEA